MVEENNIRPSKSLRLIIDYIRAKSLLEKGSTPSITVICDVIAKKIDKEKLYNEEFR